DVAHEPEGVGFVERPAGADDFPPGFGEELVMFTRRILERRGREEDLRHGKRTVFVAQGGTRRKAKFSIETRNAPEQPTAGACAKSRRVHSLAGMKSHPAATRT